MNKILLTLVILLLASPLSAYDKRIPTKRVAIGFGEDFVHKLVPREQFLNPNNYFTYVRVRAYGTAIGLYRGHGWSWFKRETAFFLGGSGFVIRKGFIMTAAHVISPDVVNTVSGKWSVRTAKPVKLLSRTILIYGFSDTPMVAKVYYIDKNLDIAILKYENHGVLEPMPYMVAEPSPYLQKGDVVATVVHKRYKDGSMDDDVEVIYGRILSTQPEGPTNRNIAWLNPYDITLKLNIQPGDSGSPLFVFWDGQPILIGIVRAMPSNVRGIAYAVTLPQIMRIIEAK